MLDFSVLPAFWAHRDGPQGLAVQAPFTFEHIDEL